MESVSEKYKTLYEKIDKTSRSRFIAARRLQLHETISLYTVVLMSCGVTALTLLDALGMLREEAGKLSAFLQVFCSMGVLVYSVIISKSNFALRAFKHHECGIALSRLRNDVFKHIVETPESDQFAKSAAQYATILENNENHLYVDFQMMKVQTKPYHSHYQVNPWLRIWVQIKHFATFWHYFLFSALVVCGLLLVYSTYGLPLS